MRSDAIVPAIFAGATPDPSSGAGTVWLCLALGLALLLTIVLILQMRRKMFALLAAQETLQKLAKRIEKGERADWCDTGAGEVDAIAGSLMRFEHRLRSKRERLREFNELMLRGAAPNTPAQLRNGVLRAMIEAMPVGVVVAEAPGGRILEGNRAIEAILRHPVIYSENSAEYHQWSAFHADGSPVATGEYPLARALAGEDQPTLECKYRRGDGSLVWISVIGAPIRNEHSEIIGAIVAMTDIDEIKNAETQRRTMNLELHHRVNNSLAMIQGIANITARSATNLASFRENFADRIQCLSRLSTLLVQNSWERTPLGNVIDATVACDEDGNRNIQIEGAPIALRSEVALAIGMALHELYSNARRFGALSQPGGVVKIDWQTSVDGPKLLLRWTEEGGPPVGNLGRAGVGFYILNNVLAPQLGGEVRLALDPTGLRAEISASI